MPSRLRRRHRPRATPLPTRLAVFLLIVPLGLGSYRIGEAAEREPIAAIADRDGAVPRVPSDAIIVPRDPAGWATEQFDEIAESQLKKLASILGSPTSQEEDVAPFVHPDFIGSGLAPATARVAWADAVFAVRRADVAELASSSGVKHRGTAGFWTAANGWRSVLQEGSPSQWSFKTVQVDLTDDLARTTVLAQMVGPTESGMAEFHGRLLVEWDTTAADSPRIVTLDLEDFERSDAQFDRAKQAALFADCTEAVLGAERSFQEQICPSLAHWLGKIESRFGMDTSGWQGLALGDANGDGLDDLFVCQPGGLPQRLYVQRADGTAADDSARAGVDWLDDTASALFVDLDNDSDQDLALATALGLLVLSNDGTGRFSSVAARFMPHAAPSAISAADFDNDGDLDLYLCGYSPRSSVVAAGFLGRPIPYHDANNGGHNVLYRNDRGWRFTDVTRSVGLDENNRRFSLAAAWEDYDNDGDLDLYVANDYGRNNLYRNDGGRFADVAAAAGVEDISSGMSVTWGDYNHDGWMDLYVSNMWSSAGHRVTYQRRFQVDADLATRQVFQRHARGNSLFLNAGDGTFRDVTLEAGVNLGRWAWGSLFWDMNNDGWEDLFVANGYITGTDPGDL